MPLVTRNACRNASSIRLQLRRAAARLTCLIVLETASMPQLTFEEFAEEYRLPNEGHDALCTCQLGRHLAWKGGL